MRAYLFLGVLRFCANPLQIVQTLVLAKISHLKVSSTCFSTQMKFLCVKQFRWFQRAVLTLIIAARWDCHENWTTWRCMLWLWLLATHFMPTIKLLPRKANETAHANCFCSAPAAEGGAVLPQIWLPSKLFSCDGATRIRSPAEEAPHVLWPKETYLLLRA